MKLSIPCLAFLIALLFCTSAFAATPAKRTSVSGQTIYTDDMLRLNVGMGPAITDFTGALDKGQFAYLGIALDVYLSIPPAALREGRQAISPEFRRFVVADFEQEFRPAWMGLIPTHLYLNPEIGHMGLVGATWQMITLTLYSISPVQEFSWKVGVRAPTITVARVYNNDRTILRENDWLFGLGASLHTKAVFHFSVRMNMSLEWTSTFYLPGEDIGIQPSGTQGIEKQWYSGTFGWLINYRFGLTKF
ncbi:hypothetical protein AGMMS49938_01620 [Fibrobacterales bacterium]|nr:hypothetical protein AGMMS49938_01620 [Fibrobacterales bacterium]